MTIDIKSSSEAMLLYYFYKDRKLHHKYDLDFFGKIRQEALTDSQGWIPHVPNIFVATEREFEIFKQGILECLGDEVEKDFFKKTHYPMQVRWEIDSRYRYLKGVTKK